VETQLEEMPTAEILSVEQATLESVSTVLPETTLELKELEIEQSLVETQLDEMPTAEIMSVEQAALESVSTVLPESTLKFMDLEIEQSHLETQPNYPPKVTELPGARTPRRLPRQMTLETRRDEFKAELVEICSDVSLDRVLEADQFVSSPSVMEITFPAADRPLMTDVDSVAFSPPPPVVPSAENTDDVKNLFAEIPGARLGRHRLPKQMTMEAYQDELPSEVLEVSAAEAPSSQISEAVQVVVQGSSLEMTPPPVGASLPAKPQLHQGELGVLSHDIPDFASEMKTVSNVSRFIASTEQPRPQAGVSLHQVLASDPVYGHPDVLTLKEPPQFVAQKRVVDQPPAAVPFTAPFPLDSLAEEVVQSDGSIVRRRVVKTRVRRIVTRRIRRRRPDGQIVEYTETSELPEEQGDDDTRLLTADSLESIRRAVSPAPQSASASAAAASELVGVHTDSLEAGEPQVDTDVRVTRETLPDGRIVERKTVRTRQRRTVVKRVVVRPGSSANYASVAAALVASDLAGSTERLDEAAAISAESPTPAVSLQAIHCLQTQRDAPLVPAAQSTLHPHQLSSITPRRTADEETISREQPSSSTEL